jgi:hypothetical protein
MMSVWRERALTLTFVFLAASVALIGPSLLGLRPSGPVLAVLLATGGLLAALRPALTKLPAVMGYDVAPHARELWLGPVVGVVMVVLLAPGGTSGELQTVGGVAGLLGMFNYFLRPLYFYDHDLLRRYLPTDRLR